MPYKDATKRKEYKNARSAGNGGRSYHVKRTGTGTVWNTFSYRMTCTNVIVRVIHRKPTTKTYNDG